MSLLNSKTSVSFKENIHLLLYEGNLRVSAIYIWDNHNMVLHSYNCRNSSACLPLVSRNVFEEHAYPLFIRDGRKSSHCGNYKNINLEF